VSVESLDLVRDLLDHELLDADGRPCGMVDDVELGGRAGAPLRVIGLLVGPSAWSARLPFGLGRIAKVLAGHGHVRVPWEAVRIEGGRVRLLRPARELGLASRERRVGRWIMKLPRA
jgi:hypothetical protein